MRQPVWDLQPTRCTISRLALLQLRCQFAKDKPLGSRGHLDERLKQRVAEPVGPVPRFAFPIQGLPVTRQFGQMTLKLGEGHRTPDYLGQGPPDVPGAEVPTPSWGA